MNKAKGKIIVCAHQPDFLPYLGFFDRLLKSDVFVVMDNVQLIKRGWHNRNRIKTPQGSMWITVPVVRKGRRYQLIREAKIDHTQPWRRKILNALKINYSKAPFFEEFFPFIEKIINEPVERLIDLNLKLLRFMLDVFSIHIPLKLASYLGVEGKKNSYLVNAVKAVGGNCYLSGPGAKEYLDENYFRQEGIEVIWQDFQHPHYPQIYGDFIPNLSCIDFLFNCGPSCTQILREGVKFSLKGEEKCTK